MAEKVTIQSIEAGYGSVATINANFTALADAIDLLLSRDGESPNEMLDHLDMNGHLILNCPNITALDPDDLISGVVNNFIIQGDLIVHGTSNFLGDVSFEGDNVSFSETTNVDFFGPVEFSNTVLFNSTSIVTFEGEIHGLYRNIAASGTYVLSSVDDVHVLSFASAGTITLLADNVAGNGFHFWVRAVGGDVTINAAASETIEGEDSLVVPEGQERLIWTSGAGGMWHMLSRGAGPIQLTELGDDITNLLGAGGDAPYSTTGLVVTTTTTTATVNATRVIVAEGGIGALAILSNPAQITINIGTAGPAAGGRDQAGAFGDDVWIHYYYIYNGTTLAGIASLDSPDDGGPTMPATYDKWAYIGANYKTAGDLRAVIQREDTIYHTGGSIAVLAAGTDATSTSVDLATAFPPNALDFDMALQLQLSGAGGAPNQYSIRLTFEDGTDFLRITQTVGAGVANIFNSYTATLPNVNQECFYSVTLDGGSTGQGFAYINVHSFRVSN